MSKASVPREKYYKLGRVAKLTGLSTQVIRRMAERGEIESRWYGSERVYPIASTMAFAQRLGVANTVNEEVDALAFGMMREGRSDEAIVIELRIPLERVLRLRAHREGARPTVAKTEAAAEESDAERELAITERRRALDETCTRERAERRKRLTG